MIKKYLNNFKIEKIKQIEQTHNFIYFFRYNDFNYIEKNTLKKEIKRLKLNFFILKQKLTKYSFVNLKGQGSLIIIYDNNPLVINNLLQKFKKLEFIYLYYQNSIFSNNKIKKIYNNKNSQNLPLNYQIKKSLFYFYNILKKIIK